MNKARYFYFLLVGRFVSGAGSFFSIVALNLFVLIKTGSPVITGLSMAVRIVAASLASPYLGNLADKIDRKKGMILSDAILGVTMLCLAFFPENNNSGLIVLIFVVQALLGTFQSFFMINFQAALPLLAPKGNLLAANSCFQVVTSVTLLIGALGAAVAIDFVGYRAAFAIDGCSYLVSLAILCFIPVVTQERRSEAVKVVKDGFFNGVSFLAKTAPFLFFLFLIRLLDGVGSGSHNVAMPIFSELADPKNPSLIYGLILAAWSFGGLASVIWMNLSKTKREWGGEKLFAFATLLMSVFWVSVFITSNPYVFLGMAILAGIFDSVATVSFSMILQRTDDGLRGRVMALATMAMASGFGGGMALASLMAGIFSPLQLVVFWHGIPVVFIIGYFICSVKLTKTVPSLKTVK